MKIKRLHIENYKSLKNVDFELNEDVNVFIGKNNSGKSNLIEALRFISKLVTSNNVQTVCNNFGGYTNIVFGKDANNKIKVELWVTLSNEEIVSLFPKLGLTPEIPLDEFQKGFGGVRYLLEFESNQINDEKIWIYFNNSEILYADRKYRLNEYDIIKSLKEGITNGEWSQVTQGTGKVSPILHVTHAPPTAEEKLFEYMRAPFRSFASLSPIRLSPERLPVLGSYELTPSADNLPQVLNSIASYDRKLFDKIMNSARDIIEEIEELRARVPEGTNETYLSMVEQPFKGKEFTWQHIASGTKEVFYLITFLHTTSNGSTLLIEEPEIHLHADAMWKFLSLIKNICNEDDKQAFMTTHSPTLVDELPIEKVLTVIKEAGETKVAPLGDGKETEEMLYKAGIPKSWLLQRKSPSFLVIVEGRDDVKVWSKFLEREDTDPIKVRVVGSGEPGNDNKAIEMGKFLKKARIPTLFKIILDSDNKKEEKEQKLKNDGFKQSEYHVLLKKEIEDYLLDPKVISGITGKSEEEVNEAITKAQGAGKEKLNNVFKNLKLSKPDEGVKELLAARVEMPEEMLAIINEIKGYLSA